MFKLRWTVGRRLAAGFGGVTAIFVIALTVALALSASAGEAWRSTGRWDRAVAGADAQIRGTQQQMAAQALYAATGERRYRTEWEAGVAAADRGSKAVAALHDATIARISAAANAADHEHDDAVHRLLFPAVARGDKAASATALRQADAFVRVPLRAQSRIAGYVGAKRAADVARAKAAERDARNAGLIAGLVGILLASGLAVLITRRIVRPLGVVVERLGTLRDELGLTGLVAELNPGGLMSLERMQRTLRILTHEVIPAFR